MLGRGGRQKTGIEIIKKETFEDERKKFVEICNDLVRARRFAGLQAAEGHIQLAIEKGE